MRHTDGLLWMEVDRCNCSFVAGKLSTKFMSSAKSLQLQVTYLVEDLSTLNIPYAYCSIRTPYSDTPTVVIFTPCTSQECIFEAGWCAHEDTMHPSGRWRERPHVVDNSL